MIKDTAIEDNSEKETPQEELFFTEGELRGLFGTEKIQKRALLTLGDVLTDVGLSIAKIALTTTSEAKAEELSEEAVVKAAKRFAALSVPMMHYIWIINANGACLFSKSYSGLSFPDTIFSGLLLGISNMVTEVTGRTLEKLMIGDLSITIQEVSPLLCAAISDDSKGIPTLVKELAKEFLKIYGHRVSESAVDITSFSAFEKQARETIRNWGIQMPSDAAGGAVAKLLDPDIIRQGVILAAQRKDLKSAVQELKGLPIFQDDQIKKLSAQLDSQVKTVERKPRFLDSDKSGKDLVNEIFSAVSRLRTSTKDLKDAEGEEDKEELIG